jgi:hypothetical protein
MDRPINPFAFFIASLIALSILLSASVLLPHDRYYRFQTLNDVTTRKADWIYERLHFDPTPIDVALIGTSRMAGGLSGPLIEKHYCAATNRKIHVANLATPVTGRNMHYVITKEAARTKSPALYVVELNDVESRRPHSGFIFLADAEDVLTAPIVINLNFLTDLFRLPGRQAVLFFETITQTPNLGAAFDVNAYSGPNLDRTQTITAIDGSTKSRRVIHTAIEMEAMGKARTAGLSPLYILPKPLRAFEYHFSRVYLRKIQEQADKTSAKIAFAYLPAFGAPKMPERLLSELNIPKPIIDLGGAPANNPSKWLDATHFNTDGAVEASLRFATALAAQYPLLGVEENCPQSHYPVIAGP